MNQQQFLQECGKSYPEALAALGYFRQLVLQRCNTVVQKRIQELGEVLGVPHQELKLLEYARPDRIVSDVPDEVILGWRAKRLENFHLYFYLSWRQPDEDYAPIGIVIGIWIKDRNKQEGLGAKLDRLSEDPAFASEPWLYYSYPNFSEFWMNVKEDELQQVDEKLDQLFGYTIGCLKSLTGIANYFQV
jgi:hypothetical protein